MKLILPDGFTTDAIFQRSEGGTPNAKDAYFSVAGVGIDKYTGAAQTFINGFKTKLGKAVDPYAILGAQAARVLLDAIANSDGSRQGVIDEVFKTKIEQRPHRLVRDQRERRHHRCEGCRAALHDLQGHEQARDPQDSRAEGESRRGGAQGSGGLVPLGQHRPGEGRPSPGLS